MVDVKPRETGGNVPRKRQQHDGGPVLAALLQSQSEHQGAPPLEPAPRTYFHPSKRSPLGEILDSAVTSHLHGDQVPTKRQQRELNRNAFTNERFPYTNPLQVGYANAVGDLERSVIPRAALEAGRPQVRVHGGIVGQGGAAGAPQSLLGYAYRNHPDIWLTPNAYMGRGQEARDTALHEIGHTLQSDAPAPKWQTEGGADFLAAALAEGMHAPEYQPAYPPLFREVRQKRDPFRTALVR